jgi:hypothetical protein
VVEVGRELRILEDEPRPEAANVPVDEARAVVELEHRALVGHRREPEAAGHPEVDEQAEPALQPQEEVLPAALDRDDGVALELLRHLEEVVRASEPRIEDLHAGERAPL